MGYTQIPNHMQGWIFDGSHHPWANPDATCGYIMILVWIYHGYPWRIAVGDSFVRDHFPPFSAAAGARADIGSNGWWPVHTASSMGHLGGRAKHWPICHPGHPGLP